MGTLTLVVISICMVTVTARGLFGPEPDFRHIDPENFERPERIIRLSVEDLVCLQPKRIGNCYGSVIRYFFNPMTSSCEQFVYSGCQGNRNNFETLEACSARCPKTSVGGSEPFPFRDFKHSKRD